MRWERQEGYILEPAYRCSCSKGARELKKAVHMVNGKIITDYFCQSCGKKERVVTPFDQEVQANYKQAREDFEMAIGTKMESTAFSQMLHNNPREIIEADPILGWKKLERLSTKRTKAFFFVNKDIERLYNEISDLSPIFDEDIERINRYNKKFRPLIDAYQEKREKKKENRRKLRRFFLRAALSLFVLMLMTTVVLAFALTREIKNNETGIVLSVKGVAVSVSDKWDLKLESKEVKEGAPAYSVATSLLHKESNKYKIYDLALSSSGKEIQPRRNVTITIPIDGSFRKENIAVFYIAPDGHCEELDYTVSSVNNTVSFETDHFSLYAVVEKPHTIRFNTNGGTVVPSQKALWGEKVDRPTDPRRLGYTFAGWVDKNGNIWDFSTKTVSHDEELSALWSPNSYTVTLDANGGDMSSNSGLNVTYDKTFSLPVPVRRGHTFKGWMLNGEKIASGTWTIAENVELIAEWSVNEYKVKYCSKQGTVEKEVSVSYGEEYTVNYPFSLVGYTFTGWYFEPSCIDKAESFVMADSDVVLYAGLTPNDYTVTLDVNGGSMNSASSMEITFGSSYNLPIPTREGYDFVGWSDGNEIVSNTGAWKKAKNTALMAEWTPKAYSITLNANGGQVSVSTITVYYGSSYELPVPTRDGCVFVGWYRSGTQYTDGRWEETENITLRAEWEKIEYTITLDPNGGQVDSAVLKVFYDSEYALSLPTKVGERFKEWNTKQDGSGAACNDLDSLNEVLLQTNGAVTLYAQWIKNTYRIVFNANTPSYGATPTQTMNALSCTYDDNIHEDGTPKRLPKNKFTVNGWYFIGWALSPNGELVFVDEAALENLSSKHEDVVNLYAVWKVDPYIVSRYVSNGVVVSDTDGESSYIVYNDFNRTSHLAGKSKVIVDWSLCKTGNNVFTVADAIDGTKYSGNSNMLEIAGDVCEVIFLGNTDSLYEVSILAAEHEQLHLNFVNFIINSAQASGADLSKVEKSVVSFKGVCNIKGADCKNNGKGFDGIIAKRLTLVLYQDTTVTIIGGNGTSKSTSGSRAGGNGIRTSRRLEVKALSSSYSPVLNVFGGNGGDGYNYGNSGGMGGAGIFADSFVVDGVMACYVYGGNGGNGKYGNAGAHGGNGAKGNNESQGKHPVYGYNGRPGEDGKDGQKGGDGGKGGSAIVLSSVPIIPNMVFITLTSGAGGNGGNGGAGGDGGDGGAGGDDDSFSFVWIGDMSGGSGGAGGNGGSGGSGGKAGVSSSPVLINNKATSLFLKNAFELKGDDGKAGARGDDGDPGSRGAHGYAGAGG